MTPRNRTQMDALFQNAFFLGWIDLGLGFLAYWTAWMARTYVHLPFTSDLLPEERWQVVDHPWLMLVTSQMFLLYVFGLYDGLRRFRYREIIALCLTACFLQVVLVSSVFFFSETIFPRTVILGFGLANFAALATWKGLIKRFQSRNSRSTLIVGSTPESVVPIIKDLEQNPWMGMEIVGVALEERSAADVEGCPVLCDLGGLEAILEESAIEEVILASPPSSRDEVLSRLINASRYGQTRITIRPSTYDMIIGRLTHVNIHDSPLIEVRQNPNQPLARFSKRLLDLLGSLVLLILFSPLLFVLAVLVKLSSHGPVFYTQERVGRAGRIFRLFKFRSMVADAERQTGATLEMRDDPRVTPLGRVLRGSKLDELPQLLNVLKGEMSFVGPRPERPEFVRVFSVEVPAYLERLQVKPGITGLAQVRGYYHSNPENKLKYDLAYIYNHSFSLDILIILETLKFLVGRR